MESKQVQPIAATVVWVVVAESLWRRASSTATTSDAAVPSTGLLCRSTVESSEWWRQAAAWPALRRHEQDWVDFPAAWRITVELQLACDWCQ